MIKLLISFEEYTTELKGKQSDISYLLLQFALYSLQEKKIVNFILSIFQDTYLPPDISSFAFVQATIYSVFYLKISNMTTKRSLLLLSNSTLHPTGYLEYAKEHICDFLHSHNVSKV